MNISSPSSSSCTISHDSTATSILSSNMDLPSPSSSSSSSSTFTSGGRLLDRHNPIITDEKRSGHGGSSSCTTTPCTNHVLQQKPTNYTPVLSVSTPKKPPHQIRSSPKPKKNKLTNKLIPKKKTCNTTNTTTTDITVEGDEDDDESSYNGRNKGISHKKPSELMMKAAVSSSNSGGVDCVSSPPESSRYLLDDTSFLEVLSDFDPVLKLMPFDSSHNISSNHNDEVGYKSSDAGRKPPKPSASSDQVVVLRVSLHCRGCERKMKKHLSKMPGVKSFNIEFGAKKVTVVGDVTPLGVLASISKVKTAKLWTPAIPSSSQLNSKNMQL